VSLSAFDFDAANKLWTRANVVARFVGRPREMAGALNRSPIGSPG
jgi:hypothetical protein